MTNKTFDDSNWREEYNNYTTSKLHLELLKNGEKSVSQFWISGAFMKSRKG